MDMILKNTFQSISPAYELIGDVTVGTATTQVDFTGLSIGKDDELLLVSDYTSGNSFHGVYLYFNNDTTASNYYAEGINVSETTVASSRENTPRISYVDSSNWRNFISTKIKLTNSGYVVIS